MKKNIKKAFRVLTPSVLPTLFILVFLNSVLGFHAIGPNNILAPECLDADSLTQTTSCGSNGTLTIKVKVNSNGTFCCPLAIDTVICRLRNNSNVVVDSIKFPISLIGNNQTFKKLPAGTFKLELRGFHGVDPLACARKNFTDYVTILSNTGISFTIANFMNESCAGNNDGSFQIKAKSGVAPYTISLNSVAGQTIKTAPENSFIDFIGLTAGTYSINIKDVGGCTADTTILIGTNGASNITIDPDITDVKCFGGNNGSISVVASGGGNNVTYIYEWPGNIKGASITNLTAGNYSLTVNPSLGCKKVFNLLVGQPNFPLNIEESIVGASCKGRQDGSISLLITGGTPPYTITWSSPITSTTTSASMLTAGNYAATITDNHSCNVIKNDLTVTEPGDISYSVKNETDPVESGQNAQLKLTGVGITSYKWSIESPILNATSVSPLSGTVSGSIGTITKKLTLVETFAPGYVTFLIQPIFSPTCKGDTTEILVKIKPNTTDAPFIPEIYTPNGDGVNDDWNIFLPDENEGTITIYNRSGAKIYEGDVAERWNGDGCPDGPYFYVLSYGLKGTDTKKVVKGAVTILRTSN